MKENFQPAFCGDFAQKGIVIKMALGRNTEELTAYTGYKFKNPDYLVTALTHSSYTNECRKDAAVVCNERMEFLGDAVLQIIISEYLYREYPTNAEGYLTKLRQHLVCEETLAKLANKIFLGDFLILGKGEEQNGGRAHNSILADAFEALLAAIYLDMGGDTSFLDAFLIALMRDELSECEKTRGGDYKTKLQQLVQQDGHEQLKYAVTAERGPDHNKTFEVDAMLNSNVVGHGIGKSKREAEQAAARAALVLFGVED